VGGCGGVRSANQLKATRWKLFVYVRSKFPSPYKLVLKVDILSVNQLPANSPPPTSNAVPPHQGTSKAHKMHIIPHRKTALVDHIKPQGCWHSTAAGHPSTPSASASVPVSRQPQPQAAAISQITKINRARRRTKNAVAVSSGRIPWPPREISGGGAQARTRFFWA
jgi:hypothetical protein